MWIDETGGADSTDTGHEGEMEISADGQTYTAEENFDLNHDGHDDAVRLDNADGTITAYVDTDGDGHADEYLHTDTQGNIAESAKFDSSTGEWLADGGDGTGSTDHTDSQAGHQGDITADMESGTVDVGPATVDSDHDGTADTAVVTDDQGNTRVFTDTNGDGNADVQTIVTPEGESHTYEHTGPATWTEASSGVTASVPADSDHFWGHGGHDTVEGVAKIDSGTGQWISQN